MEPMEESLMPCCATSRKRQKLPAIPSLQGIRFQIENGLVFFKVGLPSVV